MGNSWFNSRFIPSEIKQPPIVFACVFNGLQWQPTWWGKALNGKTMFDHLCKGAVFLPAYYLNGKIVPAGYPIASGYKKQVVLNPDKVNLRSITIYPQDKYLAFRPDKKYKLYYWDNKWVAAGEQTATAETTEMIFSSIPKNALLLLVSDYSQGKERPFVITDEGERLWW